MKRKFLIILLVATTTVFLGLIGIAYSYWAESIYGNSKTQGNNEATIGQGGEVTTTITINAQDSGGKLVPNGKATNNQVEYIIFTFDVKWIESGDANNSDGGKPTRALSAEVLNKLVGTSADESHTGLIITSIQIGGTITGATFNNDGNTDITLDANNAVKVYVKVTLNEPANATIYQAVAGKKITFDVKFSVPNE